MADYPVDYRDFLLPGTIQENWQMTNADKIGLAGVLARIRPRLALEIGVYYGGSTSLIAQYAQELICIDIDPEVVNRFDVPSNAKISIGNSADLITSILANITENRRPLEFILLDADHSAEGVQRDLEQLLRFWPTTPMVLMMHDTANRECRKGILSVDWNANPYIQSVDVDYIPGMLIEHTVASGRPECWGGLGMAYFTPQPRAHELVISQSAYTTVKTLHKSIENNVIQNA